MCVGPEDTAGTATRVPAPPIANRRPLGRSTRKTNASKLANTGAGRTAVQRPPPGARDKCDRCEAQADSSDEASTFTHQIVLFLLEGAHLATIKPANAGTRPLMAGASGRRLASQAASRLGSRGGACRNLDTWNPGLSAAATRRSSSVTAGSKGMRPLPFSKVTAAVLTPAWRRRSAPRVSAQPSQCISWIFKVMEFTSASFLTVSPDRHRPGWRRRAAKGPLSFVRPRLRHDRAFSTA